MQQPIDLEDAPKLHLTGLVVGDWSDDGHGQTELVLVESDLTKDEINAAYEQAVEITGVNLRYDVASEYEEPVITGFEWRKLREHGLRIDLLPDNVDDYGEDFLGLDIDDDIPDEDDAAVLIEAEKRRNENTDDDVRYRLDVNKYVNIYLFMVRLGAPGCHIGCREIETLNIGGYGLFFG